MEPAERHNRYDWSSESRGCTANSAAEPAPAPVDQQTPSPVASHVQQAQATELCDAFETLSVILDRIQQSECSGEAIDAAKGLLPKLQTWLRPGFSPVGAASGSNNAPLAAHVGSASAGTPPAPQLIKRACLCSGFPARQDYVPCSRSKTVEFNPALFPDSEGRLGALSKTVYYVQCGGWTGCRKMEIVYHSPHCLTLAGWKKATGGRWHCSECPK